MKDNSGCCNFINSSGLCSPSALVSVPAYYMLFRPGVHARHMICAGFRSRAVGYYSMACRFTDRAVLLQRRFLLNA